MYHSNSHRLPSPQKIHEEHKVKFYVLHLHPENDPDNDRYVYANGSKYVTICWIKDEKDTIVGEGVAACHSKYDVPNRKMGHRIAVGRAIKDFLNNKWLEQKIEEKAETNG